MAETEGKASPGRSGAGEAATEQPVRRLAATSPRRCLRGDPPCDSLSVSPARRGRRLAAAEQSAAADGAAVKRLEAALQQAKLARGDAETSSRERQDNVKTHTLAVGYSRETPRERDAGAGDGERKGRAQ